MIRQAHHERVFGRAPRGPIAWPRLLIAGCINARGRITLCALLVLAIGAMPSGGARSASVSDVARRLDLAALDLGAGSMEGVAAEPSSHALGLSGPSLRWDAGGRFSRLGVAESVPHELRGLFSVVAFNVEVDVPERTAVQAEVRGYADGHWTEWREPGAVDELGAVSAIQTRVWLIAEMEGATPRVGGGSVLLAPAVRAAQLPARRVPTVKLWATREGLVGSTTANGHVIRENDRFVALPSKRALNRRDGTDYVVMLRYRGRTAVAPVWDVGPWNIRDDYWNDTREQFSDIARWLPQAEAAFFNGHNNGRDANGRFVTIPASIDLADGTFIEDLGMTSSDWVDVTFLWVDAASPPQRPTPVVTAKSPPPGAGQRGRAASYSGIKPSARLYLPLVLNEASGWTTTLTLQNPSPAAVSGLVAVRDATGTQIGQAAFSLPPFGATTLAASAIPGVVAGFTGGAIVMASGPVAAVVEGDRPGSDRWAYEAIGEAGPSVVLPLVFKDYHDWTTGLQVQNVGGQPTTVQVQYVGESASATQAVTLAPFGTHTLYPAGGPVLSGPFVGAVVLQSDNGQPLAAVANNVNSAGAAMAYPGLPNGAAQLYAPLVFNRYHGWSSGLRLFNLAPSVASAVVAYKGGSVGMADALESTTIPGARAITLYQPAASQLPEGFVGSASVIGGPGASLAGVVSKVKAGGRIAMTYAAGRTAGPVVAVPLVTKGDDGWNTGIQVQNPGQAPSGVSLTLYDDGGALVHRVEGIIEGASAQTYYLPSMSEVAVGFRGSAIVQAPASSQGLFVVVSETAD